MAGHRGETSARRMVQKKEGNDNRQDTWSKSMDDVGQLAIQTVVWICGHSIVFWAHTHAYRLPKSLQLDFGDEAILSWHARRGMSWNQLIPLPYAVRASQRSPDIIVVHLGENNLGMLKGVELMLRARQHSGLILELFAGVNIVWSDMLQHRAWREAMSPPSMDKARRYVNREVAKFLGTIGGAVISHPWHSIWGSRVVLGGWGSPVQLACCHVFNRYKRRH
ncbi:uncharacterized protein LOC115637884 [Gopherus evgoodei]|uniref:uncharacterized protein LOC115637884 n=1 Tax=Gopherus evgoodei TaxID=1825980 RepID=UPI0011CF9A82|nr:uncharacterized protein LOC115637884 [Gopherus evgoodei]